MQTEAFWGTEDRPSRWRSVCTDESDDVDLTIMKAVSISITRRSLALIACETLLITMAIGLGAWIRLGNDTSILLFARSLPKVLLIAGLCQLCLYYLDLYELRVISDRRELFIGIVQALSATSFLLAAIYFWLPQLIVGRGVFVISSFLVMMLVAGWRFAFQWLMRRAAPRERLLVVGTGPAAVGLARELFVRRQELGVEIV